MTEEDRWKFVTELDDELLKGGVTLSEWCSFIVRESEIAFAAGAYLATIVTAVAGAETYLRSEYGDKRRVALQQLIEQSPIAETLKLDLHDLRKYRNRWVHVSEKWADQGLIDNPELYERELESMAKRAIRTLLKTIYENQWV